MFIDSHAHPNIIESEKDLLTQLNEAKANNIEGIICVGTKLLDSKIGIKISEKYPFIYPSVGIHPHEIPDIVENGIRDLEKLLDENKSIVAIGECGLDFSQEITTKIKEEQVALFKGQILLARKYDLPLIVHLRDAYEVFMNDFREELHAMQGVLHCFSGNKDYLDFVLKELPNFFISFAGNITYKNAQNLRDLVLMTPLDRLLIETDSPFLTPVPFRGEKNTSANVKIVAQTVATVKETNLEEVAKVTSRNARNLFDL